MRTVITYWISPAGQKISLLQGGTGKAQQELEVDVRDLLYPKVVEEGSITPDGDVYLTIYNNRKLFDKPQTVQEILDFISREREEKLRKEREEIEDRRKRTQDVFDQRKTTTVYGYVNLNKDGEETEHRYQVSEPYSYEKPDWPLDRDEEIRTSEAALAWSYDLEKKAQEAYEIALAIAHQKLQIKQITLREEKRKKKREEADYVTQVTQLGGRTGDVFLKVEDGELAEVPPRCWETHPSRGKNWMALIWPDRKEKGGLRREWVPRAGGKHFYILPDLPVGQAIEFGANYYKPEGGKESRRWYGFVITISKEYLVMRPCDEGKHAHNAGKKYVSEKQKEENQ